VVRMLVRNRWRLVVVTISTIQLQPGQFTLMYSGASCARSSQSVSRPSFCS
jgi:hypothetical protein